MITEPDRVAIQREYVTDATFVPRLSRTFTAFALSRPSSVWLFGLLGVFGVALLAIGALTVRNAFVAFGLAYLLFIPVYVAIIYLRTLRGNARRLPIGSRIAVVLGAETLRTEGPLGSSDSQFRAFSRVYRRGEFVILQHRGLRSYAILPAELFPGDELTRLREAVAQANA